MKGAPQYISEASPESPQLSKMESFARILNGF